MQLQVYGPAISTKRGCGSIYISIIYGINPEAGPALSADIKAGVKMTGTIIAEFRC
jgi:hypothetical protein